MSAQWAHCPPRISFLLWWTQFLIELFRHNRASEMSWKEPVLRKEGEWRSIIILSTWTVTLMPASRGVVNIFPIKNGASRCWVNQKHYMLRHSLRPHKNNVRRSPVNARLPTKKHYINTMVFFFLLVMKLFMKPQFIYDISLLNGMYSFRQVRVCGALFLNLTWIWNDHYLWKSIFPKEPLSYLWKRFIYANIILLCFQTL